MPKVTFEVWMRCVNHHVHTLCGLSVHDLPDCCFKDWYDDGKSPLNAAKKAIRMANEE